jgi:hypothetical protein
MARRLWFRAASELLAPHDVMIGRTSGALPLSGGLANPHARWVALRYEGPDGVFYASVGRPGLCGVDQLGELVDQAREVYEILRRLEALGAPVRRARS